MNSTSKEWAAGQRRIGWTLAGVAAVLVAAGLVLEAGGIALPVDPRVVTGVGILVAGLAVAALVRGGALARSRSETGLGVEERDERNVAIRRLAGSRAFAVSAALTFCLLMWTSLAANGQAPAATTDALWWGLAVAFVVPVGVYVVSVVESQRTV